MSDKAANSRTTADRFQNEALMLGVLIREKDQRIEELEDALRDLRCQIDNIVPRRD